MHITDQTAYTESLTPLIAASIDTGTPLLLVALGLSMNEHSGVLSLGAEGMMLVATMVGFMVGHQTQIPLLGFAAGAPAGMVAVALFAQLALMLITNRVVTDLILSVFGTGLSAFMGQRFVGMSLPAQAHDIPGLESIPFVGPALFTHHQMVHFSLLLCGAIAWFLFKTRAGLALRTIGGSPELAHMLGYPVCTVHFGVLLPDGTCYGSAGAYLSLVCTPMWVRNMVAGHGWITLTLTALITWRPLRILLGALLFGSATILQFHL